MEVLERRLALGAVTIISISAMLGPGVFVLPGVAILEASQYLWLAYFLALLSVLPASLSIVELATAMPTSGGAYVYIERTFGPLAGTIVGFGLWLALLFKSAFALMGIGAYLSILVAFPAQATALILLGLILVMNVFGMGKLSDIIGLVVIVASVSLIALSGWGIIGPIIQDRLQARPSIDITSGSFLAATAMVVVSYAGALKVAAIAGEVRDPDSTLPKAILYSMLIVGALYVLVAWAYAGYFYENTADLSPLYTLASLSISKRIGLVICGIALFTMMFMANAGVLAASRFPFAMARDQLLPPMMGRIHRRFLTPVPAIVMSCGLMSLIIVALNVEKLAKFASVFLILIFIMVNITVMVLRETRVQWYKPGFATPLYPFLQLFGIVIGLVLLVPLAPYLLYASVCVLIPGLGMYFLYSRKKVQRRGVMGVRGIRKDLLRASPTGIAAPTQFSEKRRNRRNARVVVSLYGKERSSDTLIELGIAVAQKQDIEVVHLTEIPEQTSVYDIEDSAAVRSLARRIKNMSEKNKASIFFDPITSHDIYATLYEISQRMHCSWLVQEWGGRQFGTFTIHNPMGWLQEHLGCHLITFRDAGVRYFRKILVCLPSEHIFRLPVKLAYDIGQMHEADEITVASFLPPDHSQERHDEVWGLLAQVIQPLSAIPTSHHVITEEYSLLTLTLLSEEYDLLIVPVPGVPRVAHPVKRLLLRGSDVLLSRAACSVILLKEAKPVEHDGDQFDVDELDVDEPGGGKIKATQEAVTHDVDLRDVSHDRSQQEPRENLPGNSVSGS